MVMKTLNEFLVQPFIKFASMTHSRRYNRVELVARKHYRCWSGQSFVVMKLMVATSQVTVMMMMMMMIVVVIIIS